MQAVLVRVAEAVKRMQKFGGQIKRAVGDADHFIMSHCDEENGPESKHYCIEKYYSHLGLRSKLFDLAPWKPLRAFPIAQSVSFQVVKGEVKRLLSCNHCNHNCG